MNTENDKAVFGTSRIGCPRLEISINKSGGSVSSSGATITSSRVIGILDGPSGGIAGSRTVNPRSYVAVNAVVGEQSGIGVGSNSDIPVGVCVAGKPLHVSINLGDDLGVGHTVDVELDILFANVRDEVSLLASGVAPAREAEKAGGMTEVPKGQGLAPSACSHFSSHDVILKEFRGSLTSGAASQLRNSKEGRYLGQ